MSCIQTGGGDHHHEVQRDERDEHAGGDDQRRPGLEPRQQRDEVGADQQDDAQLGSSTPQAGCGEEVLLQDRGHRVRSVSTGAIAADTGVTERRADAGRGRPDQHDLVGVLGGRDLAAEHVVERVDLEGRGVAAVAVEVGVHLRGGVGADLQAAERNALAEGDLDVGRPEVEALGGDHHRQRREELVVVLQNQRLGAHSRRPRPGRH
jgi:hypothetical protein